MRWIMNVRLLSSFLLGTTSAQSPHPNLSQRPDAIQRLYWESLSNAGWRNQTSTQTEMATRMEAQGKEREFLQKADKFIQAWRVLVHEYNQHGGFNLQNAKQRSTAFH